MTSGLVLVVASALLALLVATAFVLHAPRPRAALRRARTELPLLADAGVELFRIAVPEGSPLVDRSIGEVVSHPAVSVALVRRSGRSFVPAPDTPIAPGDLLLVLAGPGGRQEAVLLASIAAGGDPPP
ncbi:hypothetical protein CFN78_18680 [Amycolatopsis antarctica]|uniref:RCK C-terminal domain-containing protein n=1 Tax=Amycolatopsis antarctica TaxID=1854586 RepID=A0A263CZM3_9PSEU|nr:TrkA C-terminal domain-containing protein [Amycolatopsis antarctica]OZM71561.1 hypothetical protein CFN78_18680 [Amycolatopsis antarctica]